MRRMIVQIYEIQDPKEAEELVKIGVDHIGSVVLDKEGWKSEKLKDVVTVTKEAGKKSSMIFLFYDMDCIQRAVEYYMPDIIHLCEDITGGVEGHIEKQFLLKERLRDMMVMRSIPVPLNGKNAPFSPIDYVKDLESCTDIFLIDTYVNDAPVSGYIGITGKTCDWNMASQIVATTSKPVILGGGLNPSNVYKAISVVKPYGVDSCTGTNAIDKDGRPIRFRKDMGKVRRFIEECRRYEREETLG